MNKFANTSTLVVLLALTTASLSPAEAKGFRRTGPNGTIGAAAGRFAGPNGGSLNAAGAGFATRNAGLVGGAFKGIGPKGGTGQGAGLAGWKRGVGGFERTGMSLNGAGGSSYNGFTKGGFNAQTGQGRFSASHQIHDANNGKNYGDTNQTSYSNGKGVTQLDTDNHGDYTVDWGKGQKSSVTKDSSSN